MNSSFVVVFAAVAALVVTGIFLANNQKSPGGYYQETNGTVVNSNSNTGNAVEVETPEPRCRSPVECQQYCVFNFSRCYELCRGETNKPFFCQFLNEPLQQHNTQQVESRNENRGYWVDESLPECTGQKLSVPPADLSLVSEIIPLGNFNPPGHTNSTEHMYFHLTSPGVQLTALADIYIKRIQTTHYVDAGECGHS